MRASHVVSTRPRTTYYLDRSAESEYQQADFEVLTIVLSALEWRRHNGPVRLFTDLVGHVFYDQLGLLDVWDDGVDTDCLEQFTGSVNAGVFWSFGKILALRQAEAPCCLLDTDLLVWQNLDRLITAEVMSLHEEPLSFDGYVDRQQLIAAPGFDWNGLDWTAPPCSAALLVFTQDAFKNEYADRALSFMQDNPIRSEPGAGLPAHPLFVEQRLLPMCARAAGVRIGTFLQDHSGTELLSGEANATFTHLWNAKTVLHHNPQRRTALCQKLAHRLRRDHPETAAHLARTHLLAPYFTKTPP